MSDWIIVGDEAFTPDEYARHLQSVERRKVARRRWEEKNREHRRAYFREYSRRRRAGKHYTHLSAAELEQRIESYRLRLERLETERQRRQERRAA